MSDLVTHSFDLPNLNFEDYEPVEMYRPQIWSSDQYEIIKRHITAYENALDSEHEVGILLTNFGHSVLMQVIEISYEDDAVLIFKGMVNGKMSTLIQHMNQLNFLLTSTEKDPDRPKRKIGFTLPNVDQANVPCHRE